MLWSRVKKNCFPILGLYIVILPVTQNPCRTVLVASTSQLYPHPFILPSLCHKENAAPSNLGFIRLYSSFRYPISTTVHCLFFLKFSLTLQSYFFIPYLVFRSTKYPFFILEFLRFCCTNVWWTWMCAPNLIVRFLKLYLELKALLYFYLRIRYVANIWQKLIAVYWLCVLRLNTLGTYYGIIEWVRCHL